MPSALAISRSSGVVMKPWIRSASAPKYVVLMLTTALRISGYWRTFNSLKARSPNSRMNRLTTSASTGFLMKRSVNFMSCFFSRSAACGEGWWAPALSGTRRFRCHAIRAAA